MEYCLDPIVSAPLVENGVSKERFSLLSADYKTELAGVIWCPEDKTAARGIIQIAHGLAEHIGRYDKFARFLAKKGFVVYGYDQIGHGESASNPETLGLLPPKGGAQMLIKDFLAVKEEAQKRFEGLPLFWIGYGMGSFVVRNALFTNGGNVRGAVLLGSGHWPMPVPRTGYLLARLFSMVRKPSSYSKLLYSLADGAYASKIQDARTPFDWLNSNPDAIDVYQDDPLCGFPVKIGGYAALFDLMWPAASLMRSLTVPGELALLFAAGEQDPAGQFGKGVRKAASVYEVGQLDLENIRVQIYPEMRHDVLHETGHERVYDDILHWIEEYLAEV